MQEEHHEHIVPYKTFGIVLGLLLVLTTASVLITRIELEEFTVAAALLLAGLKSALVLIYFMHLKFDKPMYSFMVLFVIAVFIAVIVVTFLDYLYR